MGLLDFLNVILSLPPLAAILAISIAVSAVTTLAYKYTTNQKLMREIKDDIKRMQAEVRATKEPGKAAELQKEMMKHSMKQLNSSTKSMFITMIPLFLLFGWMSSHLAYEPISSGEEFTVTAHFEQKTPAPAEIAGRNITILASEGMQVLSPASQAITGSEVTWRLKAEHGGSYQLTYEFGNELYRQNILVSGSLYSNPVLAKSNGIRKDSALQKITVNLNSIRPFGSFSLFGYMPGWLATYIITSLIFSTLVRKWLKLS